MGGVVSSPYTVHSTGFDGKCQYPFGLFVKRFLHLFSKSKLRCWIAFTFCSKEQPLL